MIKKYPFISQNIKPFASLMKGNKIGTQQICSNYFLRVICLYIMLIVSESVSGQTTLISPTGDGGFETGTTFVANGWTAANGGNANRNWYIGTGQTGYTGNRCVFIGNNSTTVGTNGTARIQHFYRSITIPTGATNIQLSFNYKQAVADYSSATYYDYVAVYTSTTAPTGGTLSGGTLVYGPYPNVNVTSFTTQNVTLSNALAGTTTNLIFTFKCDGATPDGYGAVDDISLTYTAPPPTITSLGSASDCIGSSITINGTNLTGATAANVQIGGTAVSSITSNSGTVLVAVIGAGTTGTVSVTTPSGTATSGATFTVNTLPVTPGNPTSNSPQCTPPGVTLTTTGSVPAGETWYWQTTASGTATTDSGSTYVVTTSGTYYIRARNNTTGCWSATSGSLVVVVNAIPTAVITPSPATAATGVCYSGTGAISGVSWAATSGATSYDVYFGAGSLPGSVTLNVGTNSYATGTLLANTTYYWRVVAKNACGSAVGSATWTFTTSATSCSCTSTSTSSTAYFSAFSTTGGTTNISNSTGYSTNGYGDFTAQNVTQIISGTVNYSTTIVGIGGGVGVAIFVDWNQNGVFTDTGENVYNSAAYLYANPTGSFTVPAGATLGTTRMRIVANYFSNTPVSCNSGITGETEDYSFVVAAPPAPTITSLGTANGCVGSSITINGTNLTGATAANVQIGGTAVSSITSNSGTVLVAVIGAGTTGTVSVTTAGGTATSAATFTVNPLPAAPGNPTSNSPQCNPSGVTLTRSGSVPTGETWYWQTTALGTATTDSGSTYVVAASGTYYIRSQNNTTGCWSAASGSLAVVVNTLPTASITPSPATAATGVCYSGSGAITSVSWAATVGATSYDVYFGAGSLPGTVTSNVGTNSYTTGTLLANTTYYWKVVAKNACGSAVGSATWTFTTSATICHCSSTSTSSTYFINDFSTTAGTTNITNNSSGYSASGYGNFTAQVVSQVIGGSVNFSTDFNGTTNTFGFNIWVDWNNNGDFNDAGEVVYASGAYVTGATGSFIVPGTASVGNHRMRIRADYLSTNPNACGSITNGETEDYSFTVTAPSCYPTTVNAATNITSATATINWNAAAVVPGNGYQYVVSTSSTTPAGAGTAAVGLTANITGLTANTTYYVFVRSDCGSGNFSVWSPYVSFYTGYCTSTSTSSTYYINNFSTTGGTANITNNGSGYSATGYGNFTAQAVSQVNSGVVNFSTNFYDGFYTYGFTIWVDWNNDMDFNDTGELVYVSGAYVTGATGTIAVPATASVGNHRMRIRADYFSINPSICGSITSGETEDYTFTVLPPLPCSGNPSGVAVTLTSQTTSTVNWTAASPAPANGYQYFLSTTNAYPSSITGSTAAGVTTLNLTGLTALTIYYIWIRSNCGGALGQGVWIGPLNFTQPNCMPGGGSGTTTLGCPFVTSGGFGLNGTNPPTIDCTSSGCADLEATYLPLGQTTDYMVEAIPYSARPYQYNCLQNPVSVNVDDVWSPIINLPFNFCFYGNSYSSCVIGSNGVLSFNTGLASSGSGYAFSNNLPSTTGALFANTIYGVYHDIDPAIGGEVGWELITLNTGCRALVASWSNVPMFSDNTILYTGMMVLYENTNVIEVFIEEKNVDDFDISPWNGGNAIVGLQNAAGTAAVVAPGRNGLDTNWEVTNEAWRFTPSGASIATLKWFEGSGTSGPVVGTSNILHVCPTATTTYTAEVTYSLCNGTTIKETDETIVTVANGKNWDGSVSDNWNVDDNWTPSGVPTSLNCVVIPNVANDPIIYGPSYNAYGLNLTILNGATLQMNSNSTLTITDFVKVEPTASFTIRNSASLIQTSDTAINTGNIIMDRLTNIRRTDYVYWSSPVENFNASAISPGTNSFYIYKWNPSIANANNGQGNWVSGNESMIPGKGYIVRGPDSFTSSLANYTATFTGKPLNGIISPSITRGDITSIAGTFPAAPYVGTNGVTITERNDNWNLVGNPYPSAISALSFLSLNAVTNNRIVGNVRLWTHGTDISPANANSFYATYGYNYSVTDYINYNGTGPAIPNFDGLIGAGQGFFVLMNEAPTPQTSSVTFQNSMRSNTFRNDQFYRQDKARDLSTDLNTIERNRIWISIVNASNIANTTLVGYVDGATLGEDILFDAPHFIGTASSIYSLTEDKPWIIQGRPTPFDPADTVPLGVKIETAGIHNIALSLVDGLFENTNQGIYLEDTMLGIIHDLRVEPYLFTALAGIYNSRFILRYTNVSLGNNNSNANQTYAFITNNQLQIQSNNPIEEIIIYDVTGKLLKKYQPTELKNLFITDFNFANGAYIAKIKLENGSVVSRKLLH